MVFRFKLVSDEKSNFSREIEIDAEASFLSLRNAILESVGYKKDELDSFFVCDEDWQREVEITLEDMGSSSDQDVWIMDSTRLEEMLDEEGQRLQFVFDYLTERSFFLELKEMLPGRSLREPICTFKKGTPPAQTVGLDTFETEKAAAAAKAKEDMDFDFYGATDFNPEELGEGFDDLDME